MNRKLKIALAGLGLVAATGIGAGLVMAQGGGACEHGPHMMRGAWSGDFKAMADGRLERLHADLKLRTEQEAAWSDFHGTISSQAVRMGEKLKTWRDAAATSASVTTIDRLERAQKGFDDGRMALDQLTAATKRFYAALDKEQQARFDELTKRMSPGNRGWTGGPGRGA
ncbi:MAG: Spy/CpxP family protein refolding chaperone [Rhodocyclales bacterium]|nr:Spy/CpxP family protein refolding chaperone [Rhodocyclales bacterium]